MITRQKFYMTVSILCMMLAFTVYIFNCCVIPRKLRQNSEAVMASLKDSYIHVYTLKDDGGRKGTYINETNHQEMLEPAYIYTGSRFEAITYADIRKGFFLKRDMNAGEILGRSDTYGHISAKGSRLYEIKVVNSFCGELRPGEAVDLICIEDGRVILIAEHKQVKGIYGCSNSRYIEAGKIQAESETVIFVDLTESEYRDYLEHEGIHVRRMSETIDN